MDQSDEDRAARASDPSEARYVPPSVIPRPRGPAELDPAPVRLAREIDPRQQTTRRVLVLRRWWFRHRRLCGLGIVLVVASIALLMASRRQRSTMRPLPEPPVQERVLPRVVPTATTAPTAVPSAPPPAPREAAQEPDPPAEAVSAPEPTGTAKARARRVWLE